EGTFFLVLAPHSLQVIVYNGFSTAKSEMNKALANHLTTYFGIDIEQSCDLIFERIELACLLDFGLCGVGVIEILGYSLSTDLEASGNSSNSETEVFKPVNFKDQTLVHHGRSPKVRAHIRWMVAGSLLSISSRVLR